MNHYRTSTGEKVSKAEIDRRVRFAKIKVLEAQKAEHGYNFCTICNRNDCKPVDCMHIVSVDECQKSGRAELAWCTTNIVPAGRPCHKKHDKLYLFNK